MQDQHEETQCKKSRPVCSNNNFYFQQRDKRIIYKKTQAEYIKIFQFSLCLSNLQLMTYIKA